MLTLTAASEKGSPPAVFQVVIQATFESNVPVKIQYVTHRVAKAPCDREHTEVAVGASMVLGRGPESR